jgi:AraC family transcriptional regulator of adaptative response / methylphosphotriester-DNA alkyltransferase methyltransferase
MPIPKKLFARKDQITADFLRLYHAHLEALFAGKVHYRMSTSKYAEKLFVNHRHLTNTIKLTTGKSPCDFMEDGITAEAKRLLWETNLPIAEIGMTFAFDEPTNFTKFFKGMTGMTPMQFRKAGRQKAEGRS